MRAAKMREERTGKVSPGVELEGLPVIRPRVAGLDLASEVHWGCAPGVDGTGREVEKFGATTPELERMAEWLKARNVESVAMESTGVYWIAPFEVLERHGLEVVLVNTRDLARVPGRKKTDRVDCLWIQRLHSCGLLTGSFRPSEAVVMLRTMVRDRANLVAASGDETFARRGRGGPLRRRFRLSCCFGAREIHGRRVSTKCARLP